MSKHSHEGPHQSHDHSHGVVTYNKAFFIAIVANSLFVVLQLVFSWVANSTSLMADAFHNLGDVLGLILAWIGMSLMKRRPTEKATYGLKKTSILAALTNAVLLVFTCGIIAADAVYKLFSPSEIQALSVMIVAGIGMGDKKFGGIWQIPTDQKETTLPHWMSYITVDNIESKLEQAKKLGATIKVPVTAAGDMGSFAIIIDPTGAHIALWESHAS